MKSHAFRSLSTPHQVSYYTLGKPGPNIKDVWVCLHGHEQSIPDLATQLVNLDTPERLLILPEALQPALPGRPAPAQWFRSNSLGPDLALVRSYLDELTTYILRACPPGTPLTVFGYGHGATAAAVWLANNSFAYDRLIFYAAAFPPTISRKRLFVDLPRAPVVVVATTAGVSLLEAIGAGLVPDLHAAGLPVRLSYANEGPLTLAALGVGGLHSG